MSTDSAPVVYQAPRVPYDRPFVYWMNGLDSPVGELAQVVQRNNRSLSLLILRPSGIAVISAARHISDPELRLGNDRARRLIARDGCWRTPAEQEAAMAEIEAKAQRDAEKEDQARRDDEKNRLARRQAAEADAAAAAAKLEAERVARAQQQADLEAQWEKTSEERELEKLIAEEEAAQAAGAQPANA